MACVSSFRVRRARRARRRRRRRRRLSSDLSYTTVVMRDMALCRFG